VPNVRGTLDIVWTCISILLLCTWSVQHLNIQPQVKARAVRQYIRLIVFLVKRKVKWMFLTLMAPEILIGLALSQFVAARHGQDTMQEFAREDGVEWTLEHSHFADMGGFVIRFLDNSRTRDSTGYAKSDTGIAGENELSTVAATAPSESSSVGDVPSENALNSLEETPSLHRAVNLLHRGVIPVIKTPKDPRTQSLSAPLSRGMINKR
jgi:hypothetical protein